MLKFIKKTIKTIIRVAQNILMTVFLSILYILGFGVTFIFLFIFKRGILFKKHKKESTFWIKAAGYEPDADGSLRQA